VELAVAETTPNVYNITPNGVYAEIVPDTEQTSANGDLHHETRAENQHEATDAVLYSELHRNDAAAGSHIVAPSGDLYAQVQKH